MTAKRSPFVFWTCLTVSVTVVTGLTQLEQFIDRIENLPSNDEDIHAVNILYCLQDSSWALLVQEYSNEDYRRLTDQALVTRSIFKGGFGASQDLHDIKGNHTLFMHQYETWIKSESFLKCTTVTQTLAAESMPADIETHPCRKRCQCNAVYQYVTHFKNRIGESQQIAIKFEYLNEVWALTDEYHRDFERFEIMKHVYPPDMEILREYFNDCK